MTIIPDKSEGITIMDSTHYNKIMELLEPQNKSEKTSRQ